MALIPWIYTLQQTAQFHDDHVNNPALSGYFQLTLVAAWSASIASNHGEHQRP
jgi:hypothetical protein